MNSYTLGFPPRKVSKIFLSMLVVIIFMRMVPGLIIQRYFALLSYGCAGKVDLS